MRALLMCTSVIEDSFWYYTLNMLFIRLGYRFEYGIVLLMRFTYRILFKNRTLPHRLTKKALIVNNTKKIKKGILVRQAATEARVIILIKPWLHWRS